MYTKKAEKFVADLSSKDVLKETFSETKQLSKSDVHFVENVHRAKCCHHSDRFIVHAVTVDNLQQGRSHWQHELK